MIRSQIEEKIERISTFPLSDSGLPELEYYPGSYRQYLTNQQRIIDEIPGTQVLIPIVCGQVQDFEELLTKRLTRS